MKPITKTVQKKEEYFLQFSEEELKELNIEKGDKFTWVIKDGEVLLKKHNKVEVDLDEFSKDDLMKLICLSIDRQEPVDEVMVHLLKTMIENNELIAKQDCLVAEKRD
jgi:hypothetical protein